MNMRSFLEDKNIDEQLKESMECSFAVGMKIIANSSYVTEG
jgi:hypothetical protein